MDAPRHRVARQWTRANAGLGVSAIRGYRIVAVDPDELMWRRWRWWSPIDWFYRARTWLWVRRTW